LTALYDVIGVSYPASRRADPKIVAALAEMLSLNSTSTYLDVACGTGNYTRALAERGGTWHGVDISDVMLSQAKAASASVSVSWHNASASKLPFRDSTFDGAMCTLAIHHFDELLGPLREVRRVLNSGSFVLFTGLADQMRRYWLCHYFPQMMRRSIENMPARSAIEDSLVTAGFLRIECVPYYVDRELTDLFLYSGKERPHLYLQPDVRANISSFARLRSSDELERGLNALAADLESGDFASVYAAYNSAEGDYAFFIAHTDA
jgi:ubiquinone/menaquinone biosynthesis C-methylase UbiE